MPYATVDDMVRRFGSAEMIRASTPDGAEAVTIVKGPIIQALDDASAKIDTYLRKRYRVPLDLAPSEINQACCTMARYQLGFGGDRSPSDQAKDANADTLAWLTKIARGEVLLDLAEVAPGDESFATMRHRHDRLSERGGDCGDGGFYGNGWLE